MAVAMDEPEIIASGCLGSGIHLHRTALAAGDDPVGIGNFGEGIIGTAAVSKQYFEIS